MSDKPLKIVADENMPNVVAQFSPFGDVTLLPGRQICAADLREADVLLVRSVTEVNEHLLKETPVEFVGSATIGVDHVDCDYLDSRKIAFCHAPGCNAQAVVEYVVSCLAALVPQWQSATVGVVGCGNVGGRLLKILQRLGVVCKGYDPFLNTELLPLASLEAVLQSDVICLHTPLTISGEFPTLHMLDKPALDLIKPGALLINAGRGGAIDGDALLQKLQQKAFRCVLDVWEGEPAISPELLDLVDIATPHVAGYSLDGKLNGTQMVLDGFLQWLVNEQRKGQGEDVSSLGHDAAELQKPKCLSVNSLNEAILNAYDVKEDSKKFRAAIADAEEQSVATVFDQYRKNYPHRLEFSHYQVNGVGSGNLSEQDVQSLSNLGFS